MDIKQEDLIRFWTWCGWTQYPVGRDHFHYEQTKKVMNWIAPKGHWGNIGYLPRLELTEIYEYAIPKLQDKGYSVTLTANEHKGFSVRIQNEIKYSGQEIVIMDSPTEALFNAIMKVIDNETH